MANRYRLATRGDRIVEVEDPLSPEEVRARKRDRGVLTPFTYRETYRIVFRPVKIIYDGREHHIQYNYCSNPFCSWYGVDQGPLIQVGNKGHEERYRISGSERETLSSDEEDEEDYVNRALAKAKRPRGANERRLALVDENYNPDDTQVAVKKPERKWKNYKCNGELVPTTEGHVFESDYFTPISNWSLADEIARLTTHDSVVPDEMDCAAFHKVKDGRACGNRWHTPLDHPELFVKKGKSKTNSQRWQCRECGKITHVLPSAHDAPSYHKQRNEVLPKFARLVLSRTPISKVCEVLGIGRGTFYDKLTELYTRCLEFQAKHERVHLSEKVFDQLWLATDQMIYNLNNIRMRNKGGRRYKDVEPRRLRTHIVASADMDTDYVFRADLAYDWDVSLFDVINATLFYQDDYFESFSRRYGRLRRLSAYLQPPSEADAAKMTAQERAALETANHEFERRFRYQGGMHVNDTYTAMAQLWLLKQQLRVQDWFFVADDSPVLDMAILRIFADEVKHGHAQFFALSTPHLPTKAAYIESMKARKRLREWGDSNGMRRRTLEELAKAQLAVTLKDDPIYDFIVDNGKRFPTLKKQYMRMHPLPHINEGERWITCKTDLSYLSPEELAEYLFRVDGQAIDRFFQAIRRSINPLERPMLTPRGQAHSYIYANTNPYYAHMALTILRTFYNFCTPSPSKIPKPRQGSKPKKTPAMQLGIADAPFYWEDIIYYR